jgi:hypothetical protein
MPTKTIYLSALANTDPTDGGFRQFDSLNGMAEVVLHAGADCQLVSERDTGAAALTAASANGRFNSLGGITIGLRFNPSKTWIRANGTSSTTVYASITW